MKAIPLTPGRVVYSKAGRDAGRYYVVLEVLDETRVTVVDGRLHKLVAPKKKNVRHLKPKVECFASIVEKLQDGRLLDADVRKCLDDAGLPVKEG